MKRMVMLFMMLVVSSPTYAASDATLEFCNWFSSAAVRGYDLAKRGISFTAVLEHEANNRNIDEKATWGYLALKAGYAMHGDGLNVVQTHIRSKQLCLEELGKLE